MVVTISLNETASVGEVESVSVFTAFSAGIANTFELVIANTLGTVSPLVTNTVGSASGIPMVISGRVSSVEAGWRAIVRDGPTEVAGMTVGMVKTWPEEVTTSAVVKLMTFVFPGRVAVRFKSAAGMASAGVEVAITGDVDDVGTEVGALVENTMEDVATGVDADDDTDRDPETDAVVVTA